MKKKLGWLCIVITIVLCISFFVWRNRIIHVADIIDFDTITKVEIWRTDKCVTLTENEDIKKFTDILNSMELKKKLPSDKDGFVFAIDIYHKNNNKNNLALSSDIRIDRQHYRCARDYCDDMHKFYDSF
ncbi:MAG: hypothetical protein K1W24_12775 [Lachnospiraceae bacterium]